MGRTVTLLQPGNGFTYPVKAGAVATPLLFVCADVELPLLANVPLEPLAGAVKTTVAPETVLP